MQDVDTDKVAHEMISKIRELIRLDAVSIWKESGSIILDFGRFVAAVDETEIYYYGLENQRDGASV